MDWKLALTTFTAILLAEMGDKTQVAVITMTASSRRPWTVFLGAVVALASVTALGVLAGGAIAKWVPESVLKKCAAVLFMAIGLWTWVKG